MLEGKGEFFDRGPLTFPRHRWLCKIRRNDRESPDRKGSCRRSRWHFHELKLAGIQLARLEQYPIGDAYLSHIVERRGMRRISHVWSSSPASPASSLESSLMLWICSRFPYHGIRRPGLTVQISRIQPSGKDPEPFLVPMSCGLPRSGDVVHVPDTSFSFLLRTWFMTRSLSSSGSYGLAMKSLAPWQGSSSPRTCPQ